MKLFLMQVGVLQSIQAPIPTYLIQTDDGANVLVDTGWSRKAIGAYIESEQAPVRMTDQDYVVNQLAGIGICPENIDYVVCTHFDPDHAGNHDVFPKATFVVQKEHYELAVQGTFDRFNQCRDAWDRRELQYKLVDGDCQLLPGIDLIKTSGHVPGHQSLLIRLPETGPVLLAIDAIPMTKYLDMPPHERMGSPMDHDLAGLRESTRKLQNIISDEGVKLTVCGHDQAQWQHLMKAPNFYS